MPRATLRRHLPKLRRTVIILKLSKPIDMQSQLCVHVHELEPYQRKTGALLTRITLRDPTGTVDTVLLVPTRSTQEIVVGQELQICIDDVDDAKKTIFALRGLLLRGEEDPQNPGWERFCLSSGGNLSILRAPAGSISFNAEVSKLVSVARK